MSKSKYDPLRKYLKNCGMMNWHASFSDIEDIIGFKLPKSAYLYNEWWSNEDPEKTTHTQSQSWTEIGWKTSNIDLSNKTVEFSRETK